MERDDVLDLVASIISSILHDYNNIMTSIGGYLNLALTRVVDRDQEENLLEISKVILKTDRLRESLSMFYRKSTKKDYIRIDEIIKKQSINYVDRISLQLELEDILFYANYQEIEIMIKELFENSIYHSMKEKPQIIIKLYKKENIIFLEFYDNGIGIENKNIDKIFFPYFKVDRNNPRNGLGLSWIWGIVKRHNGKIKVDTLYGKYTCFVIRFLLQEDRKEKVFINVSNL